MQPDLTEDQATLLRICPNGPTKTLGIRILYEKLQRRVCKQLCLISAVVFCLGKLIAPSPSAAQSGKASTSVQAKLPVLDNGIDPLHQVSASLEALSKRVSPGVVQIFSTGYKADSDREHRNTDLLSRGLTSGSGIILASDGWIVTNAHVVQGGARIRVQLNHEASLSAPQNGRSRHALFDAKLVVADRDTDLALLKIDAIDLPTLELSDSSDLKQGQLVLAFGSPLGLDNSVSMGIVSSVARQPDPDSPTIYVQTDAAINPGNSGGPLVDTRGRVVGINTLILTQSGGNEGIGLAIPSNVVRSVYTQVRHEGHVHHHQIGVSARNITPALASGLGLEREDGIVVEDVIPDGPAASAGLMPGDIVLSVNEKPVQNIRQFALSLYPFAVGENVSLQIQRGKQTISYQVPVSEKQDVQERLADLVAKEQAKIPQLGILALTLDENLMPMLPPLRNRFGVVVAGKETYGAYGGDGPLPGDVIYSVNGTPVDSIDSLRSALDDFKTADAIALQVERLGSLHYLVLETDK
jgi:serine protease Do